MKKISIQLNLNTIVKGAGFALIGLFLGKLMTYVYKILIAHFLGAESFGIYSLGFSIMGLVSVFCLIGLPAAIECFINYYIKDKSKIKGILYLALSIPFGLSLVISLAMRLLKFNIAELFGNPLLENIVGIFALALPFYVLVEIMAAIFRAFKKQEFNVYFQVLIGGSIKILLSLIVLLKGYSLPYVIGAYTLSMILTFIIEMIILNKKIFPLFGRKIKAMMVTRKLLFFSGPLFLSSVFFIMLSWTDTLMLGYFEIETKVGVYNAALAIASLVTILYDALFTLFNPIIAGMIGENKPEGINFVYNTTTRWSFMFTWPIFILVSILGYNLLRLFFGTEFVSGYFALAALATGYFLAMIVGPSANLLEALGFPKITLVARIAAALLNIILNLTLIPMYSILGAAIATGFSILFFKIITTIMAYKKADIKPFNFSFIKPLIIGAVLGVIMWCIYPYIGNYIVSLLVFIPSYVLLYAFFFFKFKCLEGEDFKILSILEHKFGLNNKITKLIKKI